MFRFYFYTKIIEHIGRSILNTIKAILKKFDNERLAIGVAAVLGLALLVILALIAPELLTSAWYLNILIVLATYAGFIAGGAYIGRLLNLLTARFVKVSGKTKIATLFNNEVVMSRRIGPNEKWFTWVGVICGILFGAALIVLHAAIPFLSGLSYFAYFLFILGYVCGFGGLCNRFGSCIDGSRLPQEKKAILFGIVLGLLLAIGLIVFLSMTGTLPFIAVVGISKVFVDLFVLNKILFYIGFFLGITSISASFFDYFSKAYCFLKFHGLGAEDTQLNARIATRKHEYRGAFLGVITGLLLTATLITGLALTGGLLGVAPVVIGATLFIIIITCTSTLSALFSRIGSAIDGGMRPSVVTNEEDTSKASAIVPPLCLRSPEDASDKQLTSPMPAAKPTENSCSQSSPKAPTSGAKFPAHYHPKLFLYGFKLR